MAKNLKHTIFPNFLQYFPTLFERLVKGKNAIYLFPFFIDDRIRKKHHPLSNFVAGLMRTNLQKNYDLTKFFCSKIFLSWWNDAERFLWSFSLFHEQQTKHSETLRLKLWTGNIHNLRWQDFEDYRYPPPFVDKFTT